MHVAILSIGDELTLGQTVDTNSAWLSDRLAARGVSTRYHQTVSDDQASIADAIRLAADRVDLVLITGGLGPTDDDLTRQALADAMGVSLETDAAELEHIRAFFAQRNYPMAERNAVQAMRPVGAAMVTNHWGTAPGLSATLGRAAVYVMPGVPREMRSMFEHAIEPELVERGLLPAAGSGFTIATTKINTFGTGESDIADRLGELMARDRMPVVGTTVANGIVSVRVRSEANTQPDAEAALRETADAVRDRLGPIVFGDDDTTLQAAVVAKLRQARLTLATAESCTGGLIGAMLTDVPGSSAAFAGGWITYSNALKTTQLGVPEATLAQHGAVSAPVAIAMARGALDRSGADLAVSVTGIAGPDGGTPDKPVGTVWVGLASRDERRPVASAALFRLPGERNAVRDRAAKCALQMVRLHLLGEPADTIAWCSTLVHDDPATNSSRSRPA